MKMSFHETAEPRTAAVQVLLLLDAGGTVQEVLDGVLRHFTGSFQDRALVTELVYGFLREEVRLKYLSEHFLSKPEKLPREMLLYVALGMYALCFLERVPHHATVFVTVKQIRARYGESLARVANGVLRALIRLGDAVHEESFYAVQPKEKKSSAKGKASFAHNKSAAPKETEPALACAGHPSGLPAVQTTEEKASQFCVKRVSRFYSMPEWIVELWHNAYGEEKTRLLCARSRQRPHTCVRVNARRENADVLRETLRQYGEAVGEWGVAFAPGTIPEEIMGKNLRLLEEEGSLSFQAAGSQHALQVLECHLWKRPVWDACAGQGGKSLFLLEQNVPVTLLSDTDARRLGRVFSECRRLDLPCPYLVHADMRHPPKRTWEGHILLDVPCTGLGTLARRPDIRRSRKAEDLAFLSTLQKNLLEKAWQCLGAGNELAYMTCALDPEENGEQIAAFLKRHSDARLCREWETPSEHPWLEGMYAAKVYKEKP